LKEVKQSISKNSQFVLTPSEVKMRINLTTFPDYYRDALPLSYNPEYPGKEVKQIISKNF